MATKIDDSKLDRNGAADESTGEDFTGAAVDAAAPAPASARALPVLRTAMEELAVLSRPREFPEFFARFAEQNDLRMLLVKRWTSGLQVFMEKNLRLPPEASRKGRDGRAPIPCDNDDVFAATGADAAVYAGPVPMKRFPLDLTLMLGRGAKNRRIVILPLPSQDHWNTFIYLDAGQTTGRALEIAECLARYALAQMILLAKGFRRDRGRVAAILRAEEKRRRTGVAVRPSDASPEVTIEDADLWSQAQEPATEPARKEQEPGPEATPASSPAEVDPFAVLPDSAEPAPEEVPDPDGPIVLTPEMILSHSGELPALPRAACHIMAVIDDPRTTATSLEKALAMDQALTAKVLRIANSPFYGAVREIRTVSEAIVRLGFVAIRNWTLVTAARSVFLAPGAGILYRRIWKQSVLSAMASQLVAQVVGGREPESVFVGGLMQNIGQLVLARSHPEVFQDILAESLDTGHPYHEVERRLLGFDHGELGALLISEWNLSSELEDAVRWHHNFTDSEAANARTAAMIALGEEIAACSGGAEVEETVGEITPQSSDAAGFLGVSKTRLAELQKQAGELTIDPHFFS